MRRSTFVRLGLLSFGLILATFVLRGTTRMFIGDRLSLLLALPIALVALGLVSVLFGVAVLDRLRIRRMDDDL